MNKDLSVHIFGNSWRTKPGDPISNSSADLTSVNDFWLLWERYFEERAHFYAKMLRGMKQAQPHPLWPVGLYIIRPSNQTYEILKLLIYFWINTRLFELQYVQQRWSVVSKSLRQILRRGTSKISEAESHRDSQQSKLLCLPRHMSGIYNEWKERVTCKKHINEISSFFSW